MAIALNENKQERLTIREYPVAFWLVGAIGIGMGLAFVVGGASRIFGTIEGLVGVLFILLSSITTVIADRQAGSLTIRYRSLMNSSLKEYLLTEVGSVEVERDRGGEGGSVYRIAVVLKTGEHVPLHSYYSSGYSGKERKARRLREFLDLKDPSEQPSAASEALGQAMRPIFEHKQEGTTDGIAWVIEQARSPAAPVTRWSTPDFKFPGQFLFLAQKPTGTKDGLGGRLIGALSSLLFRQVIKIYGFEEEDTPGLEAARTLEGLDPGLEASFMAFTSDEEEARRLLGPWVESLLQEWARRFPLRQFQAETSEQPGQLVVMFAPQKLALALFYAQEEAQVDELTRLGVDLARELGPQPGSLPGSLHQF